MTETLATFPRLSVNLLFLPNLLDAAPIPVDATLTGSDKGWSVRSPEDLWQTLIDPCRGTELDDVQTLPRRRGHGRQPLVLRVTTHAA